MATQASTHHHRADAKQATGKLLGDVNQKTKPFQAFLQKFGNDWAMNFSGLLAYNLLTAILPIAIALFGILGFVLGGANNPFAQNLLTQIPKLFPGSSGSAIRGLLEGAISQIQKDAGILLIIAILLAIFGGSRLFITIEGCLDIVYRVRPRTIIRQNVMAILMLVIFIVLIPIMFIASTAPAFLLSIVNNVPQLKVIPFFSAFTGSFITAYLVGIGSSLLASFILFEAIYFIVPNQKISWRNSWKGAVAASVLLVLFLQLFPFYTSNFLKGYSGAIGLAVIIVLFLYYFAVILMLGAEVNAFFFECVQPLPNDLVTFVSTMAGKLNKDRPDVESEHHINPKPTNVKDRGHVAEESKELAGEEHPQDVAQREPAQEQQRAPMSASRLSKQQGHQQQVQTARGDHSRGLATLSVVFGSVLTIAIEFLRLRNHGK